MAETCGLDPEELRVCEGEFPPSESPLETAWTFWYDKKTTDRKESEQYMEGLRQLGSFNTVEGFYRHYTFLNRPSDLPRDHNLLLFRRGYKPMWEEFPEGGCWIIRIKRKVSQSYVNRMWENLLLACIGEAFELPDVAGCVLSTRVKDDVLSVWNVSNSAGHTQARFRIGEKLKEVLDLDMNALIQYKDHMQSLQDYSTYRNAKNYMFAPSPTVTPLQGTLATPLQSHHDGPGDVDFDQNMLPPAAIDDMLPMAAIDSEAFFGLGGDEGGGGAGGGGGGVMGSGLRPSPKLSAAAAPWPQAGSRGASRSPLLSASATPWAPPLASAGSATASPQLSALAPPWEPATKEPGVGSGGAESVVGASGASLGASAAAADTSGSGVATAGIDTYVTSRGRNLSPSAAPWFPAGVEGTAAAASTQAAAAAAVDEKKAAPENKAGALPTCGDPSGSAETPVVTTPAQADAAEVAATAQRAVSASTPGEGEEAEGEGGEGAPSDGGGDAAPAEASDVAKSADGAAKEGPSPKSYAAIAAAAAARRSAASGTGPPAKARPAGNK